MTDRISAEEYRRMTGQDRLPHNESKKRFHPASSVASNNPQEGAISGPKPKRPNPRPKQTPDKMNKTEQAYANEVLEPMRLAGEIYEWRFESLKVRLAKNCWYNIDFIVVGPDSIEVHEIKGTFVEDDARVKWKTAADLYWWMKFKMIKIEMKKGRIAKMNTEEYRP